MRFIQLMEAIEHGCVLMERDVLNAREIKDWAGQFVSRVQEPNAQQWLKSQLAQFLINRYEEPGAIFPVQPNDPKNPEWVQQKLQTGAPIIQVQPTDNLQIQVGYVIDWLNEWSRDNPGSRVNFTWEEAVEASEEWHKELAQMKSSDDPEDEEHGTSVVLKTSDGLVWVDIQAESCLKREGSRMGHCVGGYGSRVKSGGTKIYSLRDRKNYPHVTIEVRTEDGKQIVVRDPKQPDLFGVVSVGNVEQVKGKANRAPVGKYVPYIKEFLEKFQFPIGNGGKHDLENMGLYKNEKTGKLETLKEISRVTKKYPDGYSWATVKDGDQFKIFLVDKGWTIHVRVQTSKKPDSDQPITNLTISSGVHSEKNLSKYQKYIKDLLSNDKLKDLETYGLDRFGLFRNSYNNSIGTLDEAGDLIYQNDNGLQVYKTNSNNSVKLFWAKDDQLLITNSYNPPDVTVSGNGKYISGFGLLPQEYLKTNLGEMMTEISINSNIPLSPEFRISLGIDVNGRSFHDSSKEPFFETPWVKWFTTETEDSDPDLYAIDEFGNLVLHLQMVFEESKPEEDIMSRLAGATVISMNGPFKTARLGYFAIELAEKTGMKFEGMGDNRRFEPIQSLIEFNWIYYEDDQEYIYIDWDAKCTLSIVHYNSETDEEDTIADEEETSFGSLMSETGWDSEENLFVSAWIDLVVHGRFYDEDETYDDADELVYRTTSASLYDTNHADYEFNSISPDDIK